MRLFRAFVTFVAAVSTFYFVFWTGGALLLSSTASEWVPFLLAGAAALAVGRYIWVQSSSLSGGMVNSMAIGAFAIGGVGFAAGFFGPIIFMPEANQGPLLGIFITGPLGFVLGGIGGFVYWLV